MSEQQSRTDRFLRKSCCIPVETVPMQNQLSTQGTAALSSVPLAPPNAIFHTQALFKADPFPQKLNLGIGAYRTEEGEPYVLDVVRQAEQRIANDLSLNKEYLPIGGDQEFVKLAQGLILGESCGALREGRVSGVQALSGTGSLRILCDFIAEWLPGTHILYSNPTWGNHPAIFKRAGIPASQYRYWHPETRGLDINGLIEDIKAAPNGSIILLHPCAHNPTGVDPSQEQWKLIAQAMKEKQHLAFFDSAYQGFATGSLLNDSWSVRYFEQQGFTMFIAQSFSKNLGLYGERCGCASVVCQTPEIAKAVKSQIELIIRPMYSNPPKHGMRIAKMILGNPVMFEAWNNELGLMSGRIKEMRTALFDELVRLNTPSPSGDWKHIVDQIGMFSYTGLTPDQVEKIIQRHHVYMLKNGRISMAGLTRVGAPYLAKAIHDVVTN